MAGINFWDRSLSDQDISELFKSCASGKGNIISMADLHGMGEVEKSPYLVNLSELIRIVANDHFWVI